MINAAATTTAGDPDRRNFYFRLLGLEALPGDLDLALEFEGPAAKSPFADGEGDVPALLA